LYCCFAIGTLPNAMVISPFNYSCAWGGPQILQYFKVTNFHCNISSFWTSVCITECMWWCVNHSFKMTTGQSFAMNHTTYDENSPTPMGNYFSNYKNHYHIMNLWCSKVEIILNCRNSLPKLQKLNECYSSHQLSLNKLVNLKYKMKLNIQLVQKGSLIIWENSLLWTVRE
jgi:hypothetical protein